MKRATVSRPWPRVQGRLLAFGGICTKKQEITTFRRNLKVNRCTEIEPWSHTCRGAYSLLWRGCTFNSKNEPKKVHPTA